MSSHRPAPARAERARIASAALLLAVATACTQPRAAVPDVRAELVAVRGHDATGASARDLRGAVVLTFGGTSAPAPQTLPAPTPPVVAAATDAEFTRALELRFAAEPDVRRVVRAALEAAAIDPQNARDAARRARRAAWLPDLRLGATRQRGVDASARGTTADTSTQVGRADTLRLEASLTFTFSRLVYGADEVAWSREERAQVDARAELVREVVELFFRRRRLVVDIELLGHGEPATRLELAETEALLEVFTNGAFSRMMEARERPP